jgi:amidase
MAVIGPMARYVDDLTLAYNILRGPDPSSPHTVPTSEAHPENVDVTKLRCAIFTDAHGAPVNKEICAAVDRAGKALQTIGVPVEPAVPPIQRAAELWMAFAGADGGKELIAALGDRVQLSRERLRRYLFAPRPDKTVADFFNIAVERDKFRIELAQFMENYPIIIGAPFCVTAFEHGASRFDIDGKTYRLFESNWPAVWVNCAGLPGAVVPGGLDREGLPIGIQIVGRAFEEETILAVAQALEQELGGFQRPAL